MADKSGFQVAGDASIHYQAQVERLMAPFVDRLIGVAVQPGDTVLDVACGTGFATREALRAEYKILEDLATQIGPASSSARGTVSIFSELPVCSSCSAVIDQFTARYPNVVVNVSSG